MMERFQLLQINSQEMITSYDQDQFSNSRLLDIPGSTQQEFAMGLNTFLLCPYHILLLKLGLLQMVQRTHTA